MKRCSTSLIIREMQIKSSLLLITVCKEYIFPPFNLSVSLNVKWVSCRQHVVVGYLLLPCSRYDSLCLLIVVCESTHLIYFITSLDLDLSSFCLFSDHFIFSMFLFFCLICILLDQAFLMIAFFSTLGLLYMPLYLCG